MATANPRPEKAAQMFKTTTDGNMTVKSMEKPNMARQKMYMVLRPIKLARLSWTKDEKRHAEKTSK